MTHLSSPRRIVFMLMAFAILVAALVGVTPGSAHAASIYVSVNGSDTAGNGSIGAPFKTVQQGIDSASFGDDVLIGIGSFYGSITMADGVSLIGSGPVSTSLTGTDTAPVITAVGVGSTARITSLEVTGGVIGIKCDASSPLITRNFIKETQESTVVAGVTYGGQGILCVNLSSPIITYNTIDESQGEATGIKCVFSSPTINYNTITSANTGGIILNADSAPTIRYNTIIANTGAVGGGGGILCSSSSPTITDNTITGNVSSKGYGGGIYCLNSSPIIARNMITGNIADFYGGGGIACNNSSPTITDNTITSNSANKNGATSYGGGGILCFDGSNPTITNNTIAGNELLRGYGAGIMCSNSTPTIRGNRITDNSVSGQGLADLGYGGGGIACSNSSPPITDNIITGNKANNYGGGGILCFDQSSPAITRNTIGENTANNYGGGGISCFDFSSPSIVNNLIYKNVSSGLNWGGGGIYSGANSQPSIVNNTITGNTSVIDGAGIYGEDPAHQPIIKNCIVWENTTADGDLADLSGCSATYSDISSAITGSGVGNLSVPPSFVDTDAAAPALPDLRLSTNSPCIDVATSVGAPSVDREGAARPFGNGFDMGAYEYSGMPVYRFYNSRQAVHFYTASAVEKQNVIDHLSSTYHFEGVAYTINTGNPANNKPLYRFFNTKTGVHFYTASESEKANTIANLSSTFNYEGVAYNVCVSPPTGSKTVFRFYNMKQGVHFYTADTAEKDKTIAGLSNTYKFEGPSFYLAP